jgi:sigma-E factor negative regulatory protein RseC
MTSEEQHIENIGFVTESRNGHVKVSLLGGGCTSCHNSLCMLGESKAKELDLEIRNELFRAGDEVVVKINPSSGYKAVMLFYLLPFFIMITALWFVIRLGYNEGIAGLASITLLVPYFGILYLFRNKLRSQCKIDIEKR